MIYEILKVVLLDTIICRDFQNDKLIYGNACIYFRYDAESEATAVKILPCANVRFLQDLKKVIHLIDDDLQKCNTYNIFDIKNLPEIENQDIEGVIIF